LLEGALDRDIFDSELGALDLGHLESRVKTTSNGRFDVRPLPTGILASLHLLGLLGRRVRARFLVVRIREKLGLDMEGALLLV